MLVDVRLKHAAALPTELPCKQHTTHPLQLPVTGQHLVLSQLLNGNVEFLCNLVVKLCLAILGFSGCYRLVVAGLACRALPWRGMSASRASRLCLCLVCLPVCGRPLLCLSCGVVTFLCVLCSLLRHKCCQHGVFATTTKSDTCGCPILLSWPHIHGPHTYMCTGLPQSSSLVWWEEDVVLSGCVCVHV